MLLDGGDMHELHTIGLVYCKHILNHAMSLYSYVSNCDLILYVIHSEDHVCPVDNETFTKSEVTAKPSLTIAVY